MNQTFDTRQEPRHVILWQLFVALALVPVIAHGCSNAVLSLTPQSPGQNFPAMIGQTVLLQVLVQDACKNPITSGAVNASFSNADPDLSLSHTGGGIWSVKWTPLKSPKNSQGVLPDRIYIAIVAFSSPESILESGETSVTGSLSPPPPPPTLTGATVQNIASLLTGATIAPGMLILLNGSNLADSAGSAPNPPYSTFLNGAQVLVGGVPLALLSTATGQISAQVPYDLPLDNPSATLTVQRDSMPSTPLQLSVAPAQPGIFTTDSSGAGQGVIHKSDGVTLAKPGTPANAGEVVSINCTGLGAVFPVVPAGSLPSSDSPSITVNPVTVFIGGTLAQVQSSQLAPAEPGVFQVYAIVPAGISGDTVPIVVSVAGQSSQQVTMSIAKAQTSSTTTTLTSTLSTSIYGQSVTLIAAVSPATANGTVTFKDGMTELGTANLNSGNATLSVTTLSRGIHTLTAAYVGDSLDAPSASPIFSQAVNGVISLTPCFPEFSVTIGQTAPAPISCQFTAVVAAPFTVSTSDTWIVASPRSGILDPAAPSSLSISIDSSHLSPGSYFGSIVISGPQLGTYTLALRATVSANPFSILLPRTGLSFSALAEAGVSLPERLAILNTGPGALFWTATASTLSGGVWLQVSSPSGVTIAGGQESSVTASINPGVAAALAPGDYYGQIQVSSPVAANTPQLVTVTLTVLPAGVDPGLQVLPAGLIFAGPTGSVPAPQTVRIGASQPDFFDSSSILSTFYSYQPTSSAIQPNQPVSLTVTPDFSQLAPGSIDHSSILIQSSKGDSDVINLIAVVAPSTPVNCANFTVQWRDPSPLATLSLRQGTPQNLEVQVVDACGNFIGTDPSQFSTVQATFSNHDAPVNLVHIGNGIWTGTWNPLNLTSGSVVVNVIALPQPGVQEQFGYANPIFAILSPGDSPAFSSDSIQLPDSGALRSPIAPGALFTIRGANFADGSSVPTGPPFPAAFNGTEVFVGLESVPLSYVAPDQIDLQVPFDIPVNTTSQITIQHDNMLSLPIQVQVVEAQPGIFSSTLSGIGQGVILRSDGVTLAQPGTPASQGETVTILCSGLGQVIPPVPAGIAPPASPRSFTVNPVQVTIGGLDAQATGGSLLPGRVGVYQVIATVPIGVTGNAAEVLMTVAGHTSPPVTMAVQ